jgi:hypothetical protein
MKAPNSRRIKAAKAMALVHVNEQRAAVGLPRSTRINKLWWDMYGAEWLQKLDDKMKKKVGLNMFESMHDITGG